MTKINEVLVDILEGRMAGAIMAKHSLTPSRLEQIMTSKRMRKRRALNRKVVAVAREAWMTTQIQGLTQQMLSLAYGGVNDVARKACQTLLEQIGTISPVKDELSPPSRKAKTGRRIATHAAPEAGRADAGEAEDVSEAGAGLPTAAQKAAKQASTTLQETPSESK